MSCPPPTAVQAYVDDTAPPADADAIRAHLETCLACRALVLMIAPDAPVDAAATTRPALPPAPDGQLAPGQLVDRYVVLNRLGAGGMGVVYAAYDPELDRKLALKIIRRSAGDGDAAARELQERLKREAQAMARVAHPNVVSVHDVGRRAYSIIGVGNQAGTLVQLERFAEALPLAQQAAALAKKSLGPTANETAETLITLGSAEAGMARWSDAQAHLERGLALHQRSSVNGAQYVVGLTYLARVQLRTNPAAAIAALERALDAGKTAKLSPLLLAPTRFALAEALPRPSPAPTAWRAGANASRRGSRRSAERTTSQGIATFSGLRR
jgi:tetratricopeptide (TPR) repeat protein